MINESALCWQVSLRFPTVKVYENISDVHSEHVFVSLQVDESLQSKREPDDWICELMSAVSSVSNKPVWPVWLLPTPPRSHGDCVSASSSSCFRLKTELNPLLFTQVFDWTATHFQFSIVHKFIHSSICCCLFWEIGFVGRCSEVYDLWGTLCLELQ